MCFGGRKTLEERKICVKFTSLAFLRGLWSGPWQRPLAKWFYPQLRLVHLNLRVHTSSHWIWAHAQIQRHQNGFKIGTRQVHDTFEVGKRYFKWDSYLHIFFLQLVIFPYNSLYTQAVAYTTYFELGYPVVFPARWLMWLKGNMLFWFSDIY